MSQVIIYHNPRCSKSRQTLALLQEHGVEPEIIEYLQTPLKAKQIQNLLDLLQLEPRDIIRKSEAEYKELELNNTGLSNAALIKAIANAPKLLQRPIVVNGNKAAIGRPPENILEII